MSSTALERRGDRSIGLAYLLWLPFVFGVFGLHRFYTGRWISGIVWLFTFGLCGIGQIMDLVFIPRMVEDFNDPERRPGVW